MPKNGEILIDFKKISHHIERLWPGNSECRKHHLCFRLLREKQSSDGVDLASLVTGENGKLKGDFRWRICARIFCWYKGISKLFDKCFGRGLTPNRSHPDHVGFFSAGKSARASPFFKCFLVIKAQYPRLFQGGKNLSTRKSVTTWNIQFFQLCQSAQCSGLFSRQTMLKVEYLEGGAICQKAPVL